MIELDVVDDGNVRQILQKLCGLVEKSAVVLVAFDDEVASAADAIAALEVLGDAPDEEAGIGPAVGQQPSGQGCRGRLAMRTGDHDRSGAPQEVITDRL